MPTFQPGLGETTNVVPTGGDNYLHLRFTLESHEDDGQYEIWTNLPCLSETGQPMHPESDWNAMSFTSPHVEDAKQDRTTVYLRPIKPQDAFQHCDIVIPAKLGNFEYTFRKVVEGNIHWLGNGGYNGSINIVYDGPSEVKDIYENIGLRMDDKGHESICILTLVWKS
jgi:hypothetical protein